MSLRFKLMLLLIAFCLSIVVSAVTASRCIEYYANIAANDGQAFLPDIRRIRGLCDVLDDLADDMKTSVALNKPANNLDFDNLFHALRKGLSDLSPANDPNGGNNTEEIMALGRELKRLGNLYHEKHDIGKTAEALTILNSMIDNQVIPLRDLLSQLNHQATLLAACSSVQTQNAHVIVTGIWAANAVFALLFVVFCVYLTRRWVMNPVAALRIATKHHTAGQLQYRIPVRSKDELGMLMREVNQMADSLVENQRRMVEQERKAAVGELARFIVHNIRNTLASIRTTMEYWREKSGSNTPMSVNTKQAMGEGLKKAIEATESLDNWVTKLLLENGVPDLEKKSVFLRDLADDVAGMTRCLAENRKVTVRIDESINGQVIKVDSVRMQQALAAIVDNAVEASPRDTGATVCIFASSSDETADYIDICVRDNGAGIPESISKRIGLPYFSTKDTGTGLGVYLARQTVEAHGGTLGFAPNPEGGTTFNFRIPNA